MKYISAFDGKTLHDGTNRWSKTPLGPTKAAPAEIVQMANGSLFDPNYGNGSVVIPQPFSCTFLMKFTTEAAAESERAAIEAKLGDNGTLTASFTSGAANETCNASLDTAQFHMRRNHKSMIVVLNFVPFDDWT